MPDAIRIHTHKAILPVVLPEAKTDKEELFPKQIEGTLHFSNNI